MTHTPVTRLLSLTMMLAVSLSGSAWSKKGHQITASIAQRHLTQRTASAISELLDGDNIVYWASWLDSARDDERYAYTSTWHYINVDANETYETRYHNPAGDAVTAINWAYDVLEDFGNDKEERALAVKVMTHCVGDLHQPLHCGHKSDSGGNSIYIYYDGTRKSLHSYWDYTIVEDVHQWAYYQWSQNIDNLSQREQREITAGTIDDWARENVAVAADVYRYFPKNKTVVDADTEYWTPEVEARFQRGGLRLALLLNMALDPSFTSVSGVGADDDAPVDVYSVSGVKVMQGVTVAEAMRLLAPGFYIAGGKKILVP